MQEQCYHKMYLNEERHWWFRSKVDIIKSLINKYIGNIEEKKILDAGCGTSFLSKNISSNISNIYNVDNCNISLEYSKKRGLLNVVNADLNNLPFTDEYFDVCICMDVIEHNEDDKGLVDELARTIKKEGIIVAAVPAMPSLWGPQDKKLGHFRRYTLKEYEKIFSDKFEILKISYFNSLLLPLVFFTRKIFNFFPKFLKEKDELDINNKLLNTFFYSIFSKEASMLKYINFPAGVSLIVVGRKK